MAFRSQPLLVKVLGDDRTLRLLLNIERAAWYLAFEAAGRKYGESFFNETPPLTPEVLKTWVPAGARVLDVGCGTGRLGRLLADRVAAYLGIDIDRASVRTAQSLEHPAHVRFELRDAADLPAAQFDVVMLLHVLGNLDDPESVLESVARLAPRLIVEVPDFNHCLLNPVRLELGVDFWTDDDYVREYTQEILQRQLESTGWHISAWAHGPTALAALATRDAASS